MAVSSGFIFRHESNDPHFGDTTIDFPWLQETVSKAGLSLTGIEWSPADALQVVVKVTKLSTNT